MPQTTEQLFTLFFRIHYVSKCSAKVQKQTGGEKTTLFRTKYILRVSPLREVRILANVVWKDKGRVTLGNLAYLKEVFKLDPWTQPMMVFKEIYKW